MTWTTDQKKVIELRGRNILVSAAAGSGKTAVLVERILQKITDKERPINIDQLLIVTFTRAAAAEMRERIGKAIEAKIAQDHENSHLQKQVALLNNAQITTIDSFCLYVIRNYFHTIELDPAFRIADDAELTLLKSDVIAKLLEDWYEKADEDFLDFIESYSASKSDEPIEELILKLYQFSSSYPWPKEWLMDRLQEFAIKDAKDLKDKKWMKDLIERIQLLLEDVKELNKQALQICTSPNGPLPYLDALQSDQELIDSLVTIDTYEDYYQAFRQINYARLSTKKTADVDEEKKELVKNLRDQYKEVIKSLVADFFYQSPSEMIEDMQKVEKPMKVLIALVTEFIERLKATKEEGNLVDFSDLEHYALQILVDHNNQDAPTAAALDLSQQFEEIMIDEYQDSNEVQELILTSVSKMKQGVNNLFMVGDVKQSIYKFRLARPEIFLEKYNTYSLEDSLEQKIELSKNFRSRHQVLNSANDIFRKIMREKFGGIEYKEEVWLYTGASYPELDKVEGDQTAIDLNQTELIMLDLKETEDIISEDDSEVLELTNRELEARAIANRIQKLVKDPHFKVNDKDGLRKATYRDIVILLRTMSNWSETFIEQLGAAGIPCYSDTQSGYFQTLEVKTVLNYLRVLDNPQQDIAMTAVLYSPIGNLTSTELAILRTEYGSVVAENKRASMYDAARICASRGGNDLSDKLKKFFVVYDELKEKIAYLSVHELIQEIYQKTGYDLFVFAMPAGQQRRNNLLMLVQHAIKFEQSSFHGLFQFIRYVERLLKYEIDYGEASSIGENDNAVRIMSIHKSKGLEFPVVFLGGMGKSFNNMDSREKILFHPDYGIGPECIDTSLRTKIPTLLKRAIARKLVLDNLAEELRVLYVALTRAKEKLIMIGTVKDANKELDKFRQASLGGGEHLMFTSLMKANSYFSFVGPAVLDIPTVRISCIKVSELESQEKDKQIELERKAEDLAKENFTATKDPELKQQLLEILHFQYPYQQQAKLPIKTTVSELKKLGQQVDEEMSAILREVQEEMTALIMSEPTLPAFLKKEVEMKGSDRGTIIHKIMECMNFTSTNSKKDVIKIMDQLVEKGVLEKENISQISLTPLVTFLNSSLADRIRRAEQEGKVYKEQQFVLGIPASEVNEDYQSEDVVLIQGIIDLYFEEDDHIVLVDYKTDRIANGEEQILLKRYQKQLDYYAMAINRLRSKEVKEKIIYSFALQKEIRLD